MVAFGLALLYKLRPDLTRNASAAFASLMLSLLLVGYYLSFHQILKRKLVAVSTLIASVLATANIGLVITQTGGFDSPYLALWLVYIAALGVLGRLWPIIAAGLTLVGYVVGILVNHSSGNELTNRLIQMGLIIAAAILAQVVARYQTSRPSVTSDTSTNQSQLKAESLMASMGEGVIVVNTARQIQLFNRAAVVLMGWEARTAQNLDYRTVLKLKTATDQQIDDSHDPFMKAWHKNASVVVDNLVATTQAGRRMTITLTASPITDASGRMTGGIGLFRDVSAEKAIERQRDEFISTASHEMRTPIAAIEGYLALAMNPMTATVDARAQSYLGKAHDSIGHLGALFKNLLAITKLEDKQLADKIDVINLSQFIQQVVEDMQSVALKKSLTLQLTSGSQLVAESNPIMPIYLARGNVERLREVVMNLIDNAIKYTPSGRVTVNVTGDDDSVVVGVSDTGLGIAGEDLPHLFQKFYRVDSSATRTIGGTGLGLYICRTIIERYGGQIWVQSQVGAGSTFSFRLPRIKSFAVAAQPVAAPEPVAVTVPTPIATSAVVASPAPIGTPVDSVKAPVTASIAQSR